MSEIRFKRIGGLFATFVAVTIGPVVGYLFWCTAVTVGEPIAAQPVVAERAERLEAHVRFLAKPRSESHPEHYTASEHYIREQLEQIGWSVHSESVNGLKRSSNNLWIETAAGSATGTVVFGAHYDAAYDTPGADDNASGVAVALELARYLKTVSLKNRTIIVFFANEEPPHFRTTRMGSYQFAQRFVSGSPSLCAMFSLEMLGYYDATPGSQKYPPVLNWFYPDTGDFVGIVGNTAGRELIGRTTASFHKSSSVRAFGFAGPSWIKGLDFSDHLPFWEEGLPALMITDTSFFRNPNYHKESDLPETLDFEMMSKVVGGLESVVQEFGDGSCSRLND